MRQECAVVAVLLLVQLKAVQGFTPPSRSCRHCSNARVFRTARWSSKLFGPNDDENDNKQREEGEALAQQFYEQIRKREGEGSSASASSTEVTPKRSITSSELEDTTVQKRKFTGAPRPAADPVRAPFGSNASSDSFRGQRQTPREQMMEREFQLVGRAEKGLKYQAILAVCVFILYAYVGLTGGIQSETDLSIDVNYGDDLINDIILPVPRDSEASYWL